MERPKARRSSILSQAAQREGYDMSLERSLSEFAKQLPASAAARLSGNLTTRRSSAASHSHGLPEVLPTPVNRPMPSGYGFRGSSTTKKVSSIPRPVSAAPRRVPSSVGLGSAAGRSRMDNFVNPIVNTNQRRNRRSQSNPRDDKRGSESSSVSCASSARRLARSVSVESLCSQTPSTASRLLTKSPGKIAFPEKKDNPRNLKPPGHRDTRSLGLLATVVQDFMLENNCPQRIMFDPAKKMSLAQYLDTCRFVLQRMFGINFLQNEKQDELAARIIEISVEFKYPGILTKSILKSPNADHAWPAALSFLAFLCCRVEAALEPVVPICDDPINEIKDPLSYSRVILFESCRRLFYQVRMGEAQFEDELERYRDRLCEMKNDRLGPMEDLQKQLQEAEQEQIEKDIVDPRLEFLETKERQSATLIDLERRKTAMNEKLAKYSNIDAVEARHITLVRGLQTASKEHDELDEVLKSQKVDLNQRKNLLKEIENLRAQREAVKQVNETTQRTLKNREQCSAAVQQRFYDVCCRLNVSNTFNEHLQKLELLKELDNMERMKNNPFNPETFAPWLKATRRVHRHTKQLISQLREQTEEYIAKAESKKLRMAEAECQHEITCRELKTQLDYLKATDEDNPDLEEELVRLKSETENLMAEIKNTATLLLKVNGERDELVHCIHQLDKEHAEQDQRLSEAEKKEWKMNAALVQLSGPFIEDIQRMIAEHMEFRRQVVLDEFGFDIFKTPDDPTSRGGRGPN